MVRKKSRITDRKEIIRLLFRCKTVGRPLGIKSKILGSRTRICSIMGVVVTDDIMVILKPYDFTGEFIGKNVLAMSDISSVLPV